MGTIIANLIKPAVDKHFSVHELLCFMIYKLHHCTERDYPVTPFF